MATFKHLAPATLIIAGIMLASGLAMGAEGSSDDQANSHKTDNSNTSAHQSIASAIKGRQRQAHFRLRHEDVDVDNLSEDEARALTLRTRLNYTTGRYQGLVPPLEMDNVTEIDGDRLPHQSSTEKLWQLPRQSDYCRPRRH